MRENLNAIKRLVAFLLTVFLVGTTVWNDVFVIATEENHCSEYVDEQTYAANILQPVGEGDGYCDYCGQVEEAHIHEEAPAEEPEPEVSEETPQEETATQPEAEPEQDNSEANTEETTNTTTEETVVNDNADNSNDSNNEETPVIDKEDETETPDDEVDKKDEDEADKDKEDKEDEKDNKEECDHKWTYESKGDGTHVKKCSECGEEVTENCKFDDEGKCTLCGYEKPKDAEEEEECDHEWTYESKNNGTHIKRCKKCGEEIEEKCELDEDGKCKLCGYEDERLVYQSISRTIGGVTVTVAGNIPRGSKVTIFAKNVKKATDIVNDNLEEGYFTAMRVYDIDIYDRSGNKYQPEDNGDTVEVTFAGMSEIYGIDDSEIVVYRIEDNNTVTEMESEVVGADVYFEAEHFTEYAAGTYTNEGDLNKLELQDFEDFATIMKATSLKYTKVISATFDVYVDDASVEYNFTVETYKNVTESNPRTGTLTATADAPSGTYTFTPTKTGWTTVSIPLKETVTGNSYVSKGSNYSIVVDCDKEIIVGYGATVGDYVSPTYILKSDKTSWRNGGNQNVFYITSVGTADAPATIECTDTPTDSASLKVEYIETTAKADSNGDYHLAKGDSPITLTAVLTDNVERTITWSIDNSSDAVELSPVSGTMTATLTPIKAGVATIKAEYNGKSATIEVEVLDILIGDGTNMYSTVGDTAAYKPYYTGNDLSITVKLNNGSDISTNATSFPNFSTTIINKKDVGKRSVTVTYNARNDSESKYTFTRYFEIQKVNLVAAAFETGEYTIESKTVTEITAGTINKNHDMTLTPEWKTGFTLQVKSVNVTSSGTTYSMEATGIGNFTGTVTFTYQPTAQDISKVIRAVTTINPKYTGSAVTEDQIWNATTFYDANDNITTIVNKTTATLVIENQDGTTPTDVDKTAGAKHAVFTMSSGNFSGTVKSDFTIRQIYMSEATIVLPDGSSIAHTGSTVTPLNVEVYLGYVDETNKGTPVDASDYGVTYQGDTINVTKSSAPRVVITSTGKNFVSGSTQEAEFRIVPSFDLDLVITIDGTAPSDYKQIYSGQTTPETTDKIEVVLGGKVLASTNYSVDVYDSYTSATDNVSYKPNVGTKTIVVTGKDGTSYAGKVVTATYEVVPKPLTKNMVTYVAPAHVVFNNVEQSITAATNDDNTDKNLTVKDGDNYLEPTKDYEITYVGDRVNQGKVAFKITGKGNYSNTLSDDSYGFEIEPAKLVRTLPTDQSQDPTAIAVAEFKKQEAYTYNGKYHYPSVKVAIGNTFTESYDYNTTTQDSTNFSVSYTNNMAISTAEKRGTITITGKNNLTGEVVLNFDIKSNTDEFAAIYLGNSNTPASYIKTENGIRYYKDSNWNPVYKGTNQSKLVTIIPTEGAEALVYGTHYSTSIKNGENVNTSTTYTEASSPYIKITGLGNYAGNDAIVFFNIVPKSIEDVVITPENANVPYDSTATEAPKPDFKVILGNKELVSGTDYDVKIYDSYNKETNTPGGAEGGTKAAGVKYAVFKGLYDETTGKGNYKGTKVVEYTVGLDVNNATVAITNPFNVDDTTYCKTGSGGYEVRWINGYAPNIILTATRNDSTTVPIRYYGGKPNVTSVETENATGLSFDTTQSISGIGMYDSRAAGNTDGTYNKITLTVSGEKDANGVYTGEFFGEKVITYTIVPASIKSTASTTTGTTTDTTGNVDYSKTQSGYPYTGAEITLTINAAYKYSTGADAYNLVEDTDFKLSKKTIGPSVSSSIERIITGCGNFSGEQKVWFNVEAGDVAVYLVPTTGDNKGKEQKLELTTISPLTVTADSITSRKQEVTITDAQETYIYKKNGVYKPTLVVKNASGNSILSENTDYTLTYENFDKPTTAAEPSTAKISIPNSGNYIYTDITVKYVIQTNAIDGGTGTLKIGSTNNAPYIAKKYTATDIDAIVQRDNSSLTVKLGSQTLQYGVDYKILTDSNSEFETWKTKKNVTADISGRNTLPSYSDPIANSINYFWVQGINDYSGFIKVPFNIILDIADTEITKVTIKDPSYTLNADGTCTNADGTSKIYPLVKFRSIDATSGFGEELTENEVKSFLTITRVKEGYPGPDGNITVTGKNECKGTVLNCKYYDTSTSSNVAVKFLADLTNYTRIRISSMSTGNVYAYTGNAIEVSFVGIDDQATKVEDIRILGDYVLSYEDTAGHPLTSTINVGTYRAKITAAEKSSYFVAGTSQSFEYKIKYNLANAVLKFYEPTNNTTEIPVTAKTPYTTGGYDVKANAKIFVNGNQIYPTGNGIGDTSGWFTFTPEKLTQVGDNQPVVVTPNNDMVYNSCDSTLSIGGIDIAAAEITINGKTKPYEYDYTGDYIKPEVTVKIGADTLEKTRDYTVSYKNNKSAGTATITVTGTGAYSGTKSETFVINKVAITPDMITVEDAYYAGLGVEVRPKVTVKNKSGLVLSDTTEYKVEYERNASGARDETASNAPAVYVTAKEGSNYTGTSVEKKFTIQKLDLSKDNTNVSVSIETTEYTGQELKEYDIIKVKVGEKELDPVTEASGANDYRIEIFNASNQPAVLKEKGEYIVDIIGQEVNTTGTKEIHITITDRSLPNNWHYFYENTDFSSSTSTWTYDPSKKAFYSEPVSGSKDHLIITVYDVEEFTEGTQVTPRVTIEDTGIQITTSTLNEQGETVTTSKNKVLSSDDFELTVENASKAGTGEWSRVLKTDSTHALPTADSPAVTITGKGNYTGSITLPFNIGKNLATLVSDGKLHVKFTITNSYYTDSGTQTHEDNYGATEINYTYNSNRQVPEPKIDYTYTPTGTTSERTITLVNGTDYTVSVEDVKGEEDDSVNAGEKYLVIKGAGKYCGTLRQKYVIAKKLVDETTQTGFDKEPTKAMQTVNGGYTFIITGNTVTRLTEETAKKYLYDSANPNKYKDYIGYYYAIYNKEPIEPTVQIKDNKLGPMKNKSVVISEDDIKLDYVKSDESFDPGQNNFSEIQISFNATASDSSKGLNYYATTTGSATFKIRYIVLQGDLSTNDFRVEIINGTDGEITHFDGTEKTPTVVVTNGEKELVENTDYLLEYKDNILPTGEAKAIVTGIGNYRGTKEATFTIQGNIGTDTVEAYMDVNGNYIEGKLNQDYTGGPFEPNIYLMVRETTAMIAAGITEKDRVLKYSGNGGNAETDDYTLVGEPTSSNGFVSSGTVTYLGNGAKNWMGQKEINFNITFDENKLDLVNKGASYPYSGEPIKPTYKLPLSEKVYSIEKTQYIRGGAEITDNEDFINVGEINVIVTASVGGAERHFYDTYTITPRNLNDEDVRIIYTKNYRYTGSQIKPPVVVYIEGESSNKTLEEGTDYTVEYGKNIDGYLENKEEGSITIRSMGSNIESAVTKFFNIDVGFPVNVQIPSDKITSSSVTATWTPDVHSTGDIVRLVKLDKDKNETQVGATKRITDHKGQYTFTGLESVADYKVYVQSYVTTSNDELKSEIRSATAITGIETSSVTVASNSSGAVTISDWPTNGAVIVYKIYRSDTPDESVEGTLVACIPASVTSFTNTGLAAGTYYYYVEGYSVKDGKLMCANKTTKKPITVQ